MKMINYYGKQLLTSICLLSGWVVSAQSYHAINGSPYAGVESMYVNPASTVNSAYKWDLTIFSLQEVMSNTMFTINNGSLLNYNNAYSEFTTGSRSRFLHGNLDFSLFNFRIKLDNKSAFAFGVRGRAFLNSKTRPFYFNDTINTTQSFLQDNLSQPYLQGFGTSTAWGEINLNYSRILQQSSNSRLSAGITFAYIRGISGASGNTNHLTYQVATAPNGTNFYTITGGSAMAEYSANYDLTSANYSNSKNVKTFLKNTTPSFNLNFGVEYLFRNYTYADEELNSENYDWKIGAGILDLGDNYYKRSSGSFYASSPKITATDTSLITSLNQVNALTVIRDSLSNYFNVLDTLHGNFSIANPTRLTISVDRNLGNHFYINGQLNINFYSTEPSSNLKTRELNLLTITPRWETAKWGFYLPTQFNAQGQLWVGGAIKIGPLLIGMHSLDFLKWFKTGTQTYNGGGYIMLNIHPFGKKENDGIICP